MRPTLSPSTRIIERSPDELRLAGRAGSEGWGRLLDWVEMMGCVEPMVCGEVMGCVELMVCGEVTGWVGKGAGMGCCIAGTG